MRVAAALLLVLSILAGCSQAPVADDIEDILTPAPARTVVHRDGQPLDAAAFAGELPAFDQLHVTERISGEPTIAVTRTGAVFYPSIDFDGPNNLPRTIYYRSLDGGVTWNDFSPHIGSIVKTHPYSTDPYVYADPTTGRLFAVDMDVQASCNTVSFSDNDGQSWTTQRMTCPFPMADHPTIFSAPRGDVPTIPRPPAGPNPSYPNIVILCTNEIAQTQCTRSLDGGYSWLPSTPVYFGADPEKAQGDPFEGVCSAFTGHGHASFVDGTVYVPKAHCREPMVAISRDGGATYEAVKVYDGPDRLAQAGVHDAMVATDLNGTAYYFWIGNEGRTAMLSVSKDQGRTWSAPLNVTAPGVTAMKLPSIVAGEKGRVAFLYVGTKTPSGWGVHDMEGGEPVHQEELANATWHAFVGVSLDADAASPVFATTTVNELDEPLKRGACLGRCAGNDGGMYDFFDIDIDPRNGQMWVALVDVCTLECDEPDADASAYHRAMGAVGKQVGGTRLLDRTFPQPHFGETALAAALP